MSDALRKLLDESGAEVQYKRRVASIDESGGRWRVSPFKAAAEVYDAVVVAVPGRGVGGDNLQKIKGDWDQKLTADQSRKLRTVKHDARWSIALFLAPQARSNCDAFFGGSAIERVLDDGVLHLLSYQSRKTAQIGGVSSPEAGCVVVAHTACEWAQANIRANGRDRRLVAEISQHVTGLLGLKGPLSKHVLASKVITWKQCQVAVTYAPAQKQVNCLLVSGDPPLLLAGDYFTESSFAGCLKSGFSAAEALAEQFAGVVANSSC